MQSGKSFTAVTGNANLSWFVKSGKLYFVAHVIEIAYCLYTVLNSPFSGKSDLRWHGHNSVHIALNNPFSGKSDLRWHRHNAIIMFVTIMRNASSILLGRDMTEFLD